VLKDGRLLGLGDVISHIVNSSSISFSDNAVLLKARGCRIGTTRRSLSGSSSTAGFVVKPAVRGCLSVVAGDSSLVAGIASKSGSLSLSLLSCDTSPSRGEVGRYWGTDGGETWPWPNVDVDSAETFCLRICCCNSRISPSNSNDRLQGES
jgi:hypothetical protein